MRGFDTAPSYGGGRSEAALGEFLADRSGLEVVSTKVGLAPTVGSRPGLKTLVSVATATLPAPVTRRLRRTAQTGTSGRFTPAAVLATVEESLRRLGGRVDRLLLHEVRPAEITPELLGTLRELVDRGDVGAVGVATGNEVTAAALAAGDGLFTVAHFSVGPLSESVTLPSSVVTRVGHGLLGNGGEQRNRLQAVLDSNREVAEQWRAITAGTDFGGAGGLTAALLSRGPHLDVDDLLVATTRPGNVASAWAFATRTAPLPEPVAQALDTLVAEAGRGRPDRE
jgi:hypothetical protein